MCIYRILYFIVKFGITVPTGWINLPPELYFIYLRSLVIYNSLAFFTCCTSKMRHAQCQTVINHRYANYFYIPRIRSLVHRLKFKSYHFRASKNNVHALMLQNKASLISVTVKVVKVNVKTHSKQWRRKRARKVTAGYHHER